MQGLPRPGQRGAAAQLRARRAREAGWRGCEKVRAVSGFGHAPCHTSLPLSITHLSLGGSEP
eukprot:7204437-Prymnesium_polylepis.1